MARPTKANALSMDMFDWLPRVRMLVKLTTSANHSATLHHHQAAPLFTCRLFMHWRGNPLCAAFSCVLKECPGRMRLAFQERIKMLQVHCCCFHPLTITTLAWTLAWDHQPDDYVASLRNALLHPQDACTCLERCKWPVIAVCQGKSSCWARCSKMLKPCNKTKW